MSLHSFSSSSCSQFIVALAWCNCSRSLSKYVSKLLSNLLVTASDVDFCSMASLSVLYFSDFTLSIPLNSYALFNTLLKQVCFSPFFHVQSVPVPLAQILFLFQLIHIPIVQDNYFHLILLQKRNLPFQIYFPCRCIFFT